MTLKLASYRYILKIVLNLHPSFDLSPQFVNFVSTLLFYIMQHFILLFERYFHSLRFVPSVSTLLSEGVKSQLPPTSPTPMLGNSSRLRVISPALLLQWFWEPNGMRPQSASDCQTSSLVCNTVFKHRKEHCSLYTLTIFWGLPPTRHMARWQPQREKQNLWCSVKF